MEHKLATDEIKEQAALYALGSLSQIEARAFENHLADGCEVCQAEVAEFDSVVGVLGLGAPSATPPAHLRELLTGRLRKVMIFGFGIAFFQQATGINAIFYYLPTIFAQSGGGLSGAFAQFVPLISSINAGLW